MRLSMGIAAGLGMILTLAASGWIDANAALRERPTTQPAPKTTAQIARLIEQLGGEAFAQREAAQKALIKIGPPALPALKEARSDWSRERATRAAEAVKVIEEAAIPPKAYRDRIAAAIAAWSVEEARAGEARRLAMIWIAQRRKRTVPYLLEYLSEVSGERAVRLRKLLFEAWCAGELTDAQKTRFFHDSISARWKVDPSYLPGGRRIAVLEVRGMANVLPNGSNRHGEPWDVLKGAYTVKLDGKVIDRGRLSGLDAVYVILPEDLAPGRHKFLAVVEFSDRIGKWEFRLPVDGEIDVPAKAAPSAIASSDACPKPGTITGRVVDANGTPMANIPISAKSNAMGQPLWWGYEATGRSNEQGRFELTVPFGDIVYHVVAGSCGIHHMGGSVQAVPASARPLELRLRRNREGNIIRGKVTYPDGRPAGGLEVEVVGEYGIRARGRTDPNGEYCVTGYGYMAQTVAIVRFGNLAAPLKLFRARKKVTRNLTLEPSASLEGVVRNVSAKTPMAGARVTIRPTFSNSFRMAITTDESGRYRIDNIPPGKYLVHVTSAPGHFHWAKRWEFPEIALGSGQVGKKDIDLERLAMLRGKVVGADGKPVGGAMVAAPMKGVYDYREQYDVVTSAADGSFTIFTGVVDTSLTIGAYRSDKGTAAVTAKTVQPGQIIDDIVLKTSGTARLRATVTDPLGRPIECIACTSGQVHATSGPDGRVDFGRINLPSRGDVRVTVQAPRPRPDMWKPGEEPTMENAPTFYLHRSLAAKIKPDEEKDLKIMLTPTPLQKIFGRVVDGKGRPVAKTSVHLFTGDANEKMWFHAVMPVLTGGIRIARISDTPITSVPVDANGRWAIWTVRNSGVGLGFPRSKADWSKYCVGVISLGGRRMLVRDVVVPEQERTVELEIDIDARKSRIVTTQPASTLPAKPANK